MQKPQMIALMMEARMRSFFIFILIVLCLPITDNVYGNDSAATIEIGSIIIPDSPAFEILGVSPSSVSRPSSAHELAISIISSSNEGDSSFPKNIAIEFSPFWWRSHPKLTYDIYNPTESEIVGNNLMQTFTFSFATAETRIKKNGIYEEGTGLGFGFRTSFFKGRPSKKGQEAHRKFKKWMQDAALNMPNPATLPKDEDGDPIWEPSGLSQAQKKFRDANLQRVGWRVELGVAGSYNFPDNTKYDGEFKNAGAWLTSAYKSDEGSFLDNLEFLGVFRYLFHNPEEDSFSSYDIGGRIIWINSKEDFPLSLSGEYIYRFRSDSDKEDTKKYAFIVEYRVNEIWSIFANLGKSFDQNFEGDEEFVSMFGVNFGYGKGPAVAQKK